MKFYKYLYKSDSIKNPVKLKIKLRLHKAIPGLYIIRLAENSSDQLEIINAFYMKQKWFWHDKNEIVGMAGSYDEAVQLVVKMTEDVVSKTGDAQLKAYFIKESQH